jgi:hypothetical protein
MRKHVWKQKALIHATKALFLAKYVLKNQDSVDSQSITSPVSNE